MPEKCSQSLILHEERRLTTASLAIVLGWLVFWLFRIHSYVGSEVITGNYQSLVDLVGLGTQRQLFWAVVALSSFIGYFEFLGVVKSDRKSFIWLYEVIFIGFVFALTASVTRIADQIKWVDGLEQQGRIPTESPFLHAGVMDFLPFIVMSLCLLMWFVFLCLLIDKMKRKPVATFK